MNTHVDDALIARVGSADYPQWRTQVERSGFCARPVRVVGSAAAVDTASGEVLGEFASGSQPDGVVLLACGDRRSAVCAPCAEVYRRDMWHVVASGMAGRMPPPGGGGGTGARQGAVAGVVPDSVASHPMLFVTLTAPSFGAVHTAHSGGAGVCRPRGRWRGVCAHGRPRGCGLVHEPGHRVVGTPLCAECYDYVGHVLWHAHVGELWRRTRIAIDRALAPVASAVLGRRVTVAEVRDLLRVSYVKVAEFQRRGAVHFHVVVRLDGVNLDRSGAVVPPPGWASAGILAAAVKSAVASVGLVLPSPDGVLRVAAWGSQLDVATVSAGAAGRDVRRVAAYLAKYATKSAGDAGAAAVLARRFLRRPDWAWLRSRAGAHLARLVETAWGLGGLRELAALRLRQWAHAFGYRGHFATKSRAWSVTLGLLRGVRQAWRARQRVASGEADVWALAAAGGGSVAVVSGWRFAGQGYVGAADAGLVAMAARDRAEALTEYRDSLRRETEWSWLTG